MTGPQVSCRRCARALAPTPTDVGHLDWADATRVRSQGWVGRSREDAVCGDCLTPDEAEFLLPPPLGAREGGRFQRKSEFVSDWAVA